MRQESKIQTAEMKVLSAIVGQTTTGRHRNTHIREEFRMEGTQNQVKRNRLRWFGHVKRMDEHRIPKRVLDYKMRGKRP
jgi:hypothetical protein